MSVAVQDCFNVAVKRWGGIAPSYPLQTAIAKPLVTVAQGISRTAQYLRELEKCAWDLERDELAAFDEENGSAPTWLGDVYALVDGGHIDRAVDIVFDQIDDLLIAENFGRCNELLLTVDPQRLDTHLMVSVLSITKSAACRLPNRAILFHRVEERLRVVAPDRIVRLLDGLR